MNSFKPLMQLLLVSVLTLAWACDVVNLDVPPQDPNDQNNGPVASPVTGPTNTPSSEADFLNLLVGDSARTWQANQFSLEGISGFQNCRLDDSMTLLPDGTFTYDGGQNNCGGEDQSSATGTWTLDFDNARIDFTMNGESFGGTVTGLTEGELVITGSYIGLQIVGNYQVL